MDESTKLTPKHFVARMFFSVVLFAVPENMTIDGSIETIWIKLFGAKLGSPWVLYVEMSTIDPAIRLGCHWCLFLGKSTFFIFSLPNPGYYLILLSNKVLF
jgi:hypothetical protein